MTLKKQYDYSLYMAAEHLAEAGKHLMIFDQEIGGKYLKEAEFLLSIIQPDVEKVSEDRLNEVLSEILNSDKE